MPSRRCGSDRLSVASFVTLLLPCALLAACSGASTVPVSAGMGPAPQLPEPTKALVAHVNVAPARGWPPDARPVAASGLAVHAFAQDLDHPRWLHVLPNGDVLVAETNGPERPAEYKGIRGWVMGMVMRRAGAGSPSANRISLLRDTDGDGVADLRKPFLEQLDSPFGMALVGESFYVAEADTLVRYRLRQGEEVPAPASREVVAPLPGGPRNHHWTKSLIASADGKTLYVGVGSNSNVAENGLDEEHERAAILAIDAATGQHRVFADGLRNPVGMAWEPDSGALWVAVNERDELGDDLVPDYMTSVKDGGFYGWPWSYYGRHVDTRVKPPRPDRVAKALVPDYALGPH
ncbi:MAG: PQQ-dependent sugar dehydrogenase, partial [Panacagrimonas sp.]